MSVLVALSVTHLLNDMIQSLIPEIYPIIKETYQLDYVQIGLITLTFQIAASLLQPAVGFVTDKRPMRYSMVVGMALSLMGLIGLAYANSYRPLLIASACVGLGSSIFHPEATRLARNASGGRHGLAQGIFQVGGQTGGALGPLLAAFHYRANRAAESQLVLNRRADGNGTDGLDCRTLPVERSVTTPASEGGAWGHRSRREPSPHGNYRTLRNPDYSSVL